MIKTNSTKIDQITLEKELDIMKKIQKNNKKNRNSLSQNQQKTYTIKSFENYHDKHFINHAYKIIIAEPINHTDFYFYLSYLRAGYFSKTDILCKMRFSEKGKKKGVKIVGIKKRQIISYLSHIPKIGYFFKLLFGIAYLPKLIYKINSLETRLSQEISKNTSEKNRDLDSLYIDFENKFRGKKEDIKNRFKYYLPVVSQVIKNSDDTIMDIGCGRGEWLELLKENNFKAKGIDLNISMIKEASQNGLEAMHIDAIEYLKSVEQQSIKVITGFHIAEHMEFTQLIDLFDHSFRALKKGGIFILETPNPENILVGSCSFYTDPTHKNPIPSSTLQFIATNRGFSDVQIHKLHPLKELKYKGDDEAMKTLFSFFSKEQDYSIIGIKK